MPKVRNLKRKPQNKKPKQKQKQKQIVKQNVKVNVQSSGGLGGSSIPTIPQYIPQPYAIPQMFRDTRGEDVTARGVASAGLQGQSLDVILQKLSEVVDKFNAKPQPVEQLPPDIPLPIEYNDSAVDANKNNQLVAQVYRSRPQPNENLLSELPFNNDPMFDVLNAASQSKPKINVLRDNVAIGKKAAETRRRNKEAREAAAANDLSFENEEGDTAWSVKERVDKIEKKKRNYTKKNK
jgi:hypothetical protein